VRRLIGAKSDLKARAFNGATPAHQAAIHCHEKVLRMLIEAGADVEAQDDNGRTALICTVTEDNKNAKAEMMIRNNDGKVVPGWETLKGYREVLNVLLYAKANLNTQDSTGRTALHWAAYGRHEVVQLLLAAGANLDIQDHTGRTPFHCASIHGNAGVIGVLLAANVDSNAKDKEGRNALLWAVVYGRLEVIALLLNWNAGGQWNEHQWRRDLTAAGVESSSIDPALLSAVNVSSTFSKRKRENVMAELATYVVGVRPHDYMCHRQLGFVCMKRRIFSEAVLSYDASVLIEHSKAITQLSDITHSGVYCDDCQAYPIRGYRFKCADCDDFDLCQFCIKKPILFGHSEAPHHQFISIPSKNCVEKFQT